MKRTLVFLLFSILFISGCLLKTESMQIKEHQKLNPTSKNTGLAEFYFDDMQGLTTRTMQTNAIPLKVGLAAIMLQRMKTPQELPFTNDGLKNLFRSWGFVYAEQTPFAWNKEDQFYTHAFLPPGIISGELLGTKEEGRLEIMNFSCSGCHSGTGYHPDGTANFQHLPGIPNSSMNIDAMLDEVFAGLLRYVKEKDFRANVMATIPVLFPDVTEKELKTLKRFFPIFKQSILKFEKEFQAFSPTKFGGPGLSNAMAIFKRNLKTKKFHGQAPEEASYVSIPILFSKGLRSSILVDGSTFPKGKTAFTPMTWDKVTDEHFKQLAGSAAYFPNLVMGTSVKDSIAEIPNVEKILRYFTFMKSPRFPGSIDARKATLGAQIYRKNCLECHGVFSEGKEPTLVLYPNRFVHISKIGTDPVRVDNLDQALVDGLNRSVYKKYFDAQKNNGYVAPMLISLWATAPYLHNGSVPTLWHLMHPEERPETFMIGGHKLDFDKMGIAGVNEGKHYVYPDDYVPWSVPAVYDTKSLGKSNKGHLYPFNKLSEEEKSHLLEYLKLL